jgi:predicted nucleic acid-binding protein
LIRISQADLVQAKWTNKILDEMLRALGRNRPDISPDKLGRLRHLTNGAVRDCLVLGYEPLIEGLKLSDPADRHVLAAAIKSGAQMIVTSNLDDLLRQRTAAIDPIGRSDAPSPVSPVCWRADRASSS